MRTGPSASSAAPRRAHRARVQPPDPGPAPAGRGHPRRGQVRPGGRRPAADRAPRPAGQPHGREAASPAHPGAIPATAPSAATTRAGVPPAHRETRATKPGPDEATHVGRKPARPATDCTSHRTPSKESCAAADRRGPAVQAPGAQIAPFGTRENRDAASWTATQLGGFARSNADQAQSLRVIRLHSGLLRDRRLGAPEDRGGGHVGAQTNRFGTRLRQCGNCPGSACRQRDWSVWGRAVMWWLFAATPGGRQQSDYLLVGAVEGMITTSTAKTAKNKTMNPP